MIFLPRPGVTIFFALSSSKTNLDSSERVMQMKLQHCLKREKMLSYYQITKLKQTLRLEIFPLFCEILNVSNIDRRQVISILLEQEGLAHLAQKIIFIAGHKVTSDPVCIPFSMGRNLICIHSKKHIKNPPEDIPRKQAQNLLSMKVRGLNLYIEISVL